MDASRELLQLLDRAGEPRRHARDLAPQLVLLGGHVCFGGPQAQCERDQPVLHPVVQVALDATARFVRGGDDPPS